MPIKRLHIEPPEHIAYVSPIYVDNTYTHKFSTIQAAINWVHDSDWYSDLDVKNAAVINVYPGEYDEQLTCWAFIRIKSFNDDINLGIYKTVGLSNTNNGYTEPLLVSGPDYEYHMEGIRFYCKWGLQQPYGDFLKNARFTNCLFENGSFYETSEDMNCEMSFIDCTIYNNKIVDCTGTCQGSRYLYFHNTWIYHNIILESTHGGSDATIDFLNCPMAASQHFIKGDWDYIMNKSRCRNSYLDQRRHQFDTTGYVYILNSTIGCGIHFISDALKKVIHSCDFNDVFSTALIGGDITADATITIVDYVQNIQQNGLSGDIQIIDPIKPVGANAVNRYLSIQDAIDSMTTAGIIHLNQSYTGLAELTIPNGKTVVIDGHRSYSLQFAADIVELGLNESLTFSRITDIDGGVVEINGNGANFQTRDCNHTSTYSIKLTSGIGAHVHISNTSFTGPTGLSAIQADSLNPSILVEYSTLTGATGQPAIEFTVEADDCLQAKYSTFIHGDGGANAPITYTGTGKVDISVYSCGLNAVWNAAHFTNLIGSSNNTIDTGIDF